MAETDMRDAAEDCVQATHPVQGLPRVVRHIATSDTKVNSVFLSADMGDHYDELVNKRWAMANIFYSTNQIPVDFNSDSDVTYAQQNEPSITAKNETVCRMVDFAPGGVSPMHQVNSLGLAVIIEGVFKLLLNSGEERIMQRGDVLLQLCTPTAGST